ncbi:MAG: 16S rRNA (cytosine(1402)-N(4))-methyltransferase RsmH [Gammaproteobacteria bacterium]|nr:16S rRNA (cytosine(1402)-N(4))-methyltransferase RsmH [Gammaproteobacteria bacterium]
MAGKGDHKGGHQHQPVLLEEAVEALAIKPGGLYVDGTFGRGGHSRRILEELDESGRLIAFDKDPQAIETAEREFGGDARFRIVHGSFTMLQQVIEQEGLMHAVDGVLLDLGVSSPQLDDATRGFSFMHAGPLDMRMNTAAGETAAEWLARAPEEEMSLVLRDYGEEKFHRRIARAIVEQRKDKPLETTQELVALIDAAVPRKDKFKHPATRSFQAIRIHINRELDDLDAVLEQAMNVLAPQGRLSIISFHSLEDRRVKRFIRDNSRPPQVPRHLPAPDVTPPLKKLGKAIRAGKQELEANPRARSAVLRVAEKVAGEAA